MSARADTTVLDAGLARLLMFDTIESWSVSAQRRAP
jgi:hypothetical protein